MFLFALFYNNVICYTKLYKLSELNFKIGTIHNIQRSKLREYFELQKF